MKAGWKTKSLGEILLKTETVNPAATPEDEFEYIDVSSISNETYEIEETQQLKGKDAPSRARRLVKAGDVIFATIRPTLQRIARVPASLDGQVCSTGYFVMRPCPELDAQYLFYSLFTEQFMSGMESLQKGASYPAVTDAEVRAQQISYPAIQEQRRIVTLLDEAFADIATAKANAEKNLQNARDLLESHLQAAFTQKADWELKPFGELAEFRNGINFTKSSKGNEIKIVGVRDFQKNFWAPLDDLETIIPDGEIPASDLIETGDLLFVRSNGNPELIGRSLLIGDLHERITHSGFTIKARLRDSGLSPIYLCHYLKSGLLRREMIEGGNGANIKSLNQGTLSRLKIAYPEKSKQLLIVEHLETVQAEIAELESIYRQKLCALDELKKSLLHQAFSGQL